MEQLMVIAVVDSDASVCRALCRLLKSAGFDARGFAATERFLAALDAGEFADGIHCVVVDAHLPEMGGQSLVRTLRGRGALVPVILLTAYGAEDLMALSSDLEVADCLAKPLTAERLLSAIRQACRVPLDRRLEAACPGVVAFNSSQPVCRGRSAP